MRIFNLFKKKKTGSIQFIHFKDVSAPYTARASRIPFVYFKDATPQETTKRTNIADTCQKFNEWAQFIFNQSQMARK